MAGTRKVKAPSHAKYRQVSLSNLKRGRRGKHHDLVEGIFTELESVPAGSALQIPLDGLSMGLPNVRSAVHRGATTRGLDIETLADDKNFYVFKRGDSKVSQ